MPRAARCAGRWLRVVSWDDARRPWSHFWMRSLGRWKWAAGWLVVGWLVGVRLSRFMTFCEVHGEHRFFVGDVFERFFLKHIFLFFLLVGWSWVAESSFSASCLYNSKLLFFGANLETVHLQKNVPWNIFRVVMCQIFVEKNVAKTLVHSALVNI